MPGHVISAEGRTADGRAPLPGRGSVTLSHCMSWKAVPLARSVATAFVVVAALAGLTSCGSSRAAAPSSGFGTVFTKAHPVPSTQLVNQDGQTMSLGSFRGKVRRVVFFPHPLPGGMPLTTGIFQQLQASVKAAGLAHEVDFVEVTVDPGRDTPARLRAYQTRFRGRLDVAHGVSGQHPGLLETSRRLLPEGAGGPPGGGRLVDRQATDL